MSKNIIKKVSFRKEKDIRKMEGGGGSVLKWIEKVDIEEKQTRLICNTEMIKENLMKRAKEYSNFPIIIEATINGQAKAKSYREDINSIFLEKKDFRIIGVKGDNKILYSVDSKKIDEISQKIKTSKNKVKIIASIDEIKEYKFKIDKKIKKQNRLKIKLIDFDNKDLNNQEEKILFEKLDELNIRKIIYPNEDIIYEVKGVLTDSLISKLEDLPFLDVVEEMPTFDFGMSFDSDFLDNPSIPILDETKNYPLVGVFDSGVNREVLGDWCFRQYSPYIEEDIDTNHGTQVGSLVCFGKNLNKENLGIEGCKIISCVALPKNNMDISEAEVIENLETSLKKYSSRTEVWSLSLSGKGEVSSNEFSDFSKNLDYLQKKYNVNFVKSTGNCQNLENNRINCGAESIRSITVGSINNSSIGEEKKDEISSFSRVGPGPFSITKPDLVYYGGVACNKSGGKKGVKVVNSLGKNIENIGTSFSTPQVAALIAHLAQKLGGECSNSLLKGLLIHKSNYTNNMLGEENIKSVYGYGIPPKLDDIFNDKNDELTMVFKGKIPKGEDIGSLDIPFPDELIDQAGNLRGEITLTSVIDPILEKTQGLEYSQTNLKVAFGTYLEKKDRTSIAKRGYDIGTTTKTNLLGKGLTSKKKISSITEEGLRDKGKYSAIKKYNVNLEMLKKGIKETVKSDRNFYLTLTPEYNYYIESITPKEELSMDYCVLITIKVPGTNLNSSLVEQLDLEGYQPVNFEVEVDNEIEIF